MYKLATKHKKQIRHQKLKEAPEKGLPIYDMSARVEWEEPTIYLRSCGELSDSGRDLIDAFDGGALPILAQFPREAGGRCSNVDMEVSQAENIG